MINFLSGEETAKGACGLAPGFSGLLGSSGGAGVAAPLGADEQVQSHDLAGTTERMSGDCKLLSCLEDVYVSAASIPQN